MRKNLQLLRIENDLTQEQMAERLGVTRTTYCNIENGKSGGRSEFWLTLKSEVPQIDMDNRAKARDENEDKTESHS